MTAPKPEEIASHRAVHESGVIYLDVGIQPHIANVIEGMEPWADKLVSAVNTIDTAIAERDDAIARADRLEVALRKIAELEYADRIARNEHDSGAMYAFNHCAAIATNALSAAKVGGAG